MELVGKDCYWTTITNQWMMNWRLWVDEDNENEFTSEGCKYCRWSEIPKWIWFVIRFPKRDIEARRSSDCSTNNLHQCSC